LHKIANPIPFIAGYEVRSEASKSAKAVQLSRELVILARETAAGSEQLAEGSKPCPIQLGAELGGSRNFMAVNPLGNATARQDSFGAGRIHNKGWCGGARMKRNLGANAIYPRN
jgi:hypothetical protein